MRPQDYFALAWSAAWERRGRTIGAIVGIIIAVVALGLALGMGQGYRVLTAGFFERVLGTNTILLYPGQGSQLTLTDVYSVLSIPHVTNAVPLLSMPVRVNVNGHEIDAMLVGTTERVIMQAYAATSLSAAVLSGTPLLAPGVALLGYNVAFTETGQQIVYPGQTIIITTPGGGELYYSVGAIMKPSIGSLGLNPNNAVFIDQETYVRQFDPSNTVNGIIIYVDSADNINYVTNALRSMFPMDQVLNLSTLVSSVNQFFTILEAFLAFISGISFVIIGIWMFDTMTISVIQRTREFGIMRAVGFSGRSIPQLLVMEALMISVIGSAIGTALLAIISSALPRPETTMRFGLMIPILLTPLDEALIFALPIVINVIAASLPAIRAMRVPPAQVLRYE